MIHENKIRKLWSKIPEIKCKGYCHQSCTVILMSSAEKKMISERVGEDKFDGHILTLLTQDPSCMKCPMLKDQKCSIYDIRPAVCRLYGVVQKMKCLWGCQPKKYLKDKKAKEILMELDKIK